MDPEFNSFLQGFREKHQNLTFLDLSHYAKDFESFRQMKGLSREEMEVIEEFRKRRMEHRALDFARNEDTVKARLKELDKPHTSKRTRQEFDSFKFQAASEAPLRQGPFELRDHFVTLILDRDTTTQITTLNRIRHFRYLVFMGNCNGVVSYGRGQGNDFEKALSNSLHNCKKNLVALKYDPLHTFPQDVRARFQNYQCKFESRGGFNPWGHPLLSLMVTLSGCVDLRFDVRHRSKNMYGLVNAFFKVVSQNTTPQDLSELHGFKVYSRSWRRPRAPFRGLTAHPTLPD